MSIPTLRYEIHPLESVKVRRSARPSGKTQTLADLTSRCEVSVGGGDFMLSTPRFWGSVFSLFGISASIFRYFGHDEVMKRICERRGSTDLRFCVEPGKKLGSMLAVSSPVRSPITTKEVLGVARKHEPRAISYHKGVATLTMVPKSGAKEMKIGPDMFRNEYVVDVPLDGYGGPSTYLSLLRLLCENGAVGRVPEFRSDIVIGKEDPVHALSRALDTFEAEEGYDALRKRFRAAQTSPASVRECLSLLAMLKPAGKEATKRYEAAAGDLCGLYGMANMHELSEKKQRVLPAKCTVYDLVNVASEVSTHVTEGTQAIRIESWIGTVMREEFDLEGVTAKASDFRALFGAKGGAS